MISIRAWALSGWRNSGIRVRFHCRFYKLPPIGSIHSLQCAEKILFDALEVAITFLLNNFKTSRWFLAILMIIALYEAEVNPTDGNKRNYLPTACQGGGGGDQGFTMKALNITTAP